MLIRPKIRRGSRRSRGPQPARQPCLPDREAHQGKPREAGRGRREGGRGSYRRGAPRFERRRSRQIERGRWKLTKASHRIAETLYKHSRPRGRPGRSADARAAEVRHRSGRWTGLRPGKATWWTRNLSTSTSPRSRTEPTAVSPISAGRAFVFFGRKRVVRTDGPHFRRERLTTNGIQRTSPPQAVQKIRDGVFHRAGGAFQKPQRGLAATFLRRAAGRHSGFRAAIHGDIGDFLRFKVDPSGVEQKIRVLDRWMDRANQKEATMGGRTEVQRQKKRKWTAKPRNWRDGMTGGRSCDATRGVLKGPVCRAD